MNRWLIVLLLVVIVVGAVALGLLRGKPVDVAVARRGDVRSFVDEQGKTRLAHVYRITAPYSGRVLKLDLEEGSTVGKGQVVAQIDPADLASAVNEAEAEVNALTAQIALNDFNKLEESARQELDNVLAAMGRVVEAAQLASESSAAVKELASKRLERREMIRQQTEGAVSTEDLETAETSQATSALQRDRDLLYERAIVALNAAFHIGPRYIDQWLERKQLNRDVLLQQRARAEAVLAKARRDQQRGKMISPADGVVLHRQVANERTLASGELIMEIGSLQDLEVEADILSQDVIAIRPGNPVEIHTLTSSGAPLKGTVKRVFPAGFKKVSSLGVEQQRVRVIIAFDSAALQQQLETQQLGTDYQVRVRVFTGLQSDTVAIPRNSIFQGESGGWQAFVIRDGKAALQTIEVGVMNDEEIEVLSGLDADQMVVLAPDMSLADGDRVTPREVSSQ